MPDGFVISTSAYRDRGKPGVRAAIVQAATQITWPVAVRSSAVGEDSEVASHAGMYETILDVSDQDELAVAVRRCWESAVSERVTGYRGGEVAAMAILVQQMVHPDSAGVMFTADPLTGEDQILISAVLGLGDKLVSGEATADEWVVRGARATRRSDTAPVLRTPQVLELAALGRRIASTFGRPQDIEWAIAGGRLWALQARPITAPPIAVEWTAPAPGAYARNFRLGEWLGEPVTPLFESWALTRMEERMHQVYQQIMGAASSRPLHVIVNGWYYYSLNFIPGSPGAALRLLAHVIPRIVLTPRRVAVLIPPIAHLGIGLYEREWRDELLPRYRSAIVQAEREVDTLPVEELPRFIDQLTTLAGDYFTSITIVGGHAWKSELELARLYRRELEPVLGGSHLDLLHGLVRTSVLPHSVSDLDWYHPTLGERGPLAQDVEAEARFARLVAERSLSEERARALLRARSRLARRFDRLLAEAQRAHQVREEQIAEFTRPWPLFRRALARIADALVMQQIVASPDDVHFLAVSELREALRGRFSPDLRELVVDRRRTREEQRRLVAPLLVGSLPRIAERVLGGIAGALRSGRGGPAGALMGVPAAGGRATGSVRVILSLDDSDRLRPGDVLVTRATTPAWTPLFTRVAAVVTDVGSASSHASIIGREYGIPVVVACGSATVELRDGEWVEVDGGAGSVRRVPHPRPSSGGDAAR